MRIAFVTEQVLEKLTLAAKAIDYVNGVEGISSANQYTDIAKTHGSVRAGLHVVRSDSRGNPRDQETSAKYAIALKSGNCGEKAQLAYYWLVRTLHVPIWNVYLVGWNHGDHAFTLLGDIGDPATLVVADPWPKRTQACLWRDSAWCVAGAQNPLDDVTVLMSGKTKGESPMKNKTPVPTLDEFVAGTARLPGHALRGALGMPHVYDQQYVTRTGETYVYKAVKPNGQRHRGTALSKPVHMLGAHGKGGTTLAPSAMVVFGTSKPLHRR